MLKKKPGLVYFQSIDSSRVVIKYEDHHGHAWFDAGCGNLIIGTRICGQFFSGLTEYQLCVECRERYAYESQSMQPLATRSLVGQNAKRETQDVDAVTQMVSTKLHEIRYEVKLDEDEVLVENKYLKADALSDLFGHHSGGNNVTFCNRIFGNGVDPLGRSVINEGNHGSASHRVESLSPLQYAEQGIPNYGDDDVPAVSAHQSSVPRRRERDSATTSFGESLILQVRSLTQSFY